MPCGSGKQYKHCHGR
ncbi:SEC-C metal-binding domain-containing protein [Aerococcus urinaeequi]